MERVEYLSTCELATWEKREMLEGLAEKTGSELNLGEKELFPTLMFSSFLL